MMLYNTLRMTRELNAFLGQAITIGGYTYVLNRAFAADPIMSLIANYHYKARSALVDPRVLDKSPLHTNVYARNYYLAGLNLFADLAFKKYRKKIRYVSPSWNRRRSIRSRGMYLATNDSLLSDLVSGFVLPVGFSSDTEMRVPTSFIAGYPSGGASRHVPWEGIELFAQRLQKYVGYDFYLPGSAGQSAYHTLTSLRVEPGKITYTLSNLSGVYFPNSRKIAIPAVKVTIRRYMVKGGAPTTEVTLRGVNLAIGFLNATQYPLPYTENGSQRDVIITAGDETTRDGWEVFNLGMFGKNVAIDNLRGALYHTQGKALGKILLDLDKNFENVIESASFFPMIDDLINDPNVNILLSSATSNVDRIKSLTSIISSATLAWNFAIKPTVEALYGLLNGYIQPLKGEATMSFEVDRFEQLPDGLGDLLTKGIVAGFGGVQEFNVQCRFRTEVWTSPSIQNFVQTLYNENLLVGAGVFPTPSGAWAATKASFVLDWFLPIGRQLDDHQSYCLSFMLPFRMGHSAWFQVSLVDGRVIELFLRSQTSGLPLDPPEESWLVAPGLPPISIALSTQMLLGLV